MLALILLLFIATSAQVAPPPKCCTPRQYEAELGETGETQYHLKGVKYATPVDVSIPRLYHNDKDTRTYFTYFHCDVQTVHVFTRLINTQMPMYKHVPDKTRSLARRRN